MSALQKWSKIIICQNRALIRGKIEGDIFANEKIAVDDLRSFYAEYIEEKYEDEELFASLMPPGFSLMNMEIQNAMKELIEIRAKELIEEEGEKLVYEAICTDREMFYQAKELVIKFDRQINNL